MLVRESLFEELKYFKGKSEEEIDKSLEGLSLEKRIVLAIKNNIHWIIKDCIDNNIDLTFNKNFPIQYTAMNNAVEIAKMLLDDGKVDITEEGLNGNAIQIAFLKYNNELLKLFLEHPYARKQLNKHEIELIENRLRIKKFTINYD